MSVAGITMRARRTAVLVTAVATIVAALAMPATAGDDAPTATAADRKLDRAIERFVELDGGSPGIVAVVQRPDGDAALHTSGDADVATGAAATVDDRMRLASVAKAFSGAAALSVVAEGKLTLSDTVGSRVAGVPAAWADEPLEFEPGSEYRYSNSDNIAVGLMIESATGRTYEQELQARVFTPLGLSATSLPSDALLTAPFIHGYDVSGDGDPEDISEIFAAGWTWASGGIVASPADANRFVRGYAAGATTNEQTKTEQFDFVDGHSEPPGPGTNEAGLAIFRYTTRCGTVYGHTGNTAGYTQFVSATDDGTRSATVAINAQITPKNDKATFKALRRIFGLAVCAALAEST